MKHILLFLGLIIAQSYSYSQERVTTFGIQVKPLIPSTLLGTGLEELVGESNDYQMQQRVGYSFGGVMRKGLTKWLSIETGISYVRRNYEARVFNPISNFSDTTQFRIIGYEIPVTGLVFVQLAERIYMDGALGIALDMFPSDVESTGKNYSFY